MAIELIPLATAVFKVAPIVVGPVDAGLRVVGEVTESTWIGDRLTAEQVGRAGADWAIVTKDGIIQVDVRVTLKTHDGAIIYVQYRGRSRPIDGANIAFVAPIFETGDERYAWLNGVQAVGRGTKTGDLTVSYEFYELN